MALASIGFRNQAVGVKELPILGLEDLDALAVNIHIPEVVELSEKGRVKLPMGPCVR
jgi:hypothetical protein